MSDGLLGRIGNYFGTPCREAEELEWAELMKDRLRLTWPDVAKAKGGGSGGAGTMSKAEVTRDDS